MEATTTSYLCPRNRPPVSSCLRCPLQYPSIGAILPDKEKLKELSLSKSSLKSTPDKEILLEIS